MTLQGKRAIALGGTSGIGLAATNQLASEGGSVIAASRHPQRAQQSGGLGSSSRPVMCKTVRR